LRNAPCKVFASKEKNYGDSREVGKQNPAWTGSSSVHPGEKTKVVAGETRQMTA